LSLGDTQRDFSKCLGILIVWAYANGYEITLGDAWGDPSDGRHIPNSNHYRRLAIDLNLFIDGAYQSSTESHRPLGDFWKTLDERARWGGDFDDGNHYSFEWEGVA